IRICIHFPTALPKRIKAAIGANKVTFVGSYWLGTNKYAKLCSIAPVKASEAKLSVVGSCASPMKPAESVVMEMRPHPANKTKLVKIKNSGADTGSMPCGTARDAPAAKPRYTRTKEITPV